MRRYIDADKLQEEFKELHDGKRSLLIDTQPTADVVEVVRCKDCKYNPKSLGWVTCPMTGANTRKDDDYCSYGERKEQENE